MDHGLPQVCTLGGCTQHTLSMDVGAWYRVAMRSHLEAPEDAPPLTHIRLPELPPPENLLQHTKPGASMLKFHANYGQAVGVGAVQSTALQESLANHPHNCLEYGQRIGP